ncbi:hypothetical protein KAI92_05125 [Candidatus Parcubacteria bacterium]|nr:hypothetical protein [Candidatus Parcubacteria bacterium]
MNSKTKILIGILAVGVIFFSGLFILEQISKQQPIEKAANGGEIVDGLQLIVEPLNGLMDEAGLYIFQKNEPFKIKVTLENTGDKELNLLIPDGQTVFDKVFYFQILDINGTVIETDTRLITMFSVATIGPEKILLQPNEKHSFFTHINSEVSSKDYSVEHHHFDTNLVRKFPDICFDEKYCKIRGIYDGTVANH